MGVKVSGTLNTITFRDNHFSHSATKKLRLDLFCRDVGIRQRG